VGPRTVLDSVAKRKIPSHRRESNPRTTIVQPVQIINSWSIFNLLKGEGKFVSRHEDVWGSEDIAPPTLKIGTRRE
jgi:hemin uptake protein HemP